MTSASEANSSHVKRVARDPLKAICMNASVTSTNRVRLRLLRFGVLAG